MITASPCCGKERLLKRQHSKWQHLSIYYQKWKKNKPARLFPIQNNHSRKHKKSSSSDHSVGISKIIPYILFRKGAKYDWILRWAFVLFDNSAKVLQKGSEDIQQQYLVILFKLPTLCLSRPANIPGSIAKALVSSLMFCPMSRDREQQILV